jgi:hypothetical protein
MLPPVQKFYALSLQSLKIMVKSRLAVTFKGGKI